MYVCACARARVLATMCFFESCPFIDGRKECFVILNVQWTRDRSPGEFVYYWQFLRRHYPSKYSTASACRSRHSPGRRTAFACVANKMVNNTGDRTQLTHVITYTMF